MLDKIANVFATLAIAAVITTLVLPGRETANVVRASTTGLADVTNASIGRG